MSILGNLNDAVQRRMALKVRQDRLPGALGDYPADLPNRVLTTKGIAERGPIDAPVVSPESGKSEIDVLTQIRDLLTRMPAALSTEWRTRFIVQPRESLSFVSSNEVVAVAPGTAVSVVAQTVNENFTGFLTHVGVDVLGAGGFADIAWQIRVGSAVNPTSGAIHPKFMDRYFAASTLSTPLPFALELMQSRTVQLVAINNGAVARTVRGVLLGWTEFMTQGKPYGAAPSTVVA